MDLSPLCSSTSLYAQACWPVGHRDVDTRAYSERPCSFFSGRDDTAFLAALCAFPRLALPGSITSPSYTSDLKGITYYFNYLSLIN